MNTEKYGFTAKVTSQEPGLYLRIPNLTVETSSLEHKELLHLKIRDMDGKTVDVSRKVLESSGQYKVYLPKDVKEDLGLGHNDLVDVFFTKD